MTMARNYKEGVHPPFIDSTGGAQAGSPMVWDSPATSGDPQAKLPTGTAPWLSVPAGINETAGAVGGSGTTAGEPISVTRQGLTRVLLKNGTSSTRGGKLIASATLGYVQPYTDFSFSAWILGTAEEAATADSTSYHVEAYIQPFLQAVVRPVNAGCAGTITAATKYLGDVSQAKASAQVVRYMARFTGEVIRNLSCNLVTAPGGTDTVAFTVQKSSDNGATWSDTALTATITGTAKSATDLTHTETLTAGDLLAVKAVSSAGTAADAFVVFDVT